MQKLTLWNFWRWNNPDTKRVPCQDDERATDVKPVVAMIQTKNFHLNFQIHGSPDSNTPDNRKDYSFLRDDFSGGRQDSQGHEGELHNRRFHIRLPSDGRSTRCSG